MGVNAQEYGYFFNSSSNDRTYNAESFEAWIKPLLSNGVFGTGLKVSAQSTPNMSVSVDSGYANVSGKVGAWTSASTLTIATAHGSYGRIDTVVIRRDNTNRKISLEVVTGTAALTPSAPTPTRNADTYELVIAKVYVGAGVTSINAGNITDTRIDTDLCGFVTCPVVNPDFSDLYDQFTAQFDDWFDSMKGQLSEDAAGNLQLEIDAINADMTTLGNNLGTPTSSIQGYLRRKIITYTNKTIPADGYLKIDSYTGLGLSNSDYLMAMNIRGFNGFSVKTSYTIAKGSNGTDIYIIGEAGTIGSITVEYFVWCGYANTNI